MTFINAIAVNNTALLAEIEALFVTSEETFDFEETRGETLLILDTPVPLEPMLVLLEEVGLEVAGQACLQGPKSHGPYETIFVQLEVPAKGAIFAA